MLQECRFSAATRITPRWGCRNVDPGARSKYDLYYKNVAPPELNNKILNVLKAYLLSLALRLKAFRVKWNFFMAFNKRPYPNKYNSNS